MSTRAKNQAAWSRYARRVFDHRIMPAPLTRSEIETRRAIPRSEDIRPAGIHRCGSIRAWRAE